MFSLLRNIILRLLLVMTVSSLLELLLPEGGTRPFVRLVLGLTVLAVCLEPLLQFPAG